MKELRSVMRCRVRERGRGGVWIYQRALNLSQQSQFIYKISGIKRPTTWSTAVTFTYFEIENSDQSLYTFCTIYHVPCFVQADLYPLIQIQEEGSTDLVCNRLKNNARMISMQDDIFTPHKAPTNLDLDGSQTQRKINNKNERKTI